MDKMSAAGSAVANLRFGSSGASNSTVLNNTRYCPPGGAASAAALLALSGLGMSANLALMTVILSKKQLRRWSHGLLFHQAVVDCARAAILLPLGIAVFRCQPVYKCSLVETAFLLLVTVSTVNMLTTVLNDSPIFPENEEEQADLSAPLLMDSPQCVLFGTFMIWFASITINLGPTFLSGALAASAGSYGTYGPAPSCPLVRGPYRHYVLNALWISVNAVCVGLTVFHLKKLHRDLTKANVEAVRVAGLVTTLVSMAGDNRRMDSLPNSVGPRTVDGALSDGQCRPTTSANMPFGGGRRLRGYLARVEREGVRRVRMFLVITAAYVLFWGPLFIITLLHHPALTSHIAYEAEDILSGPTKVSSTPFLPGYFFVAFVCRSEPGIVPSIVGFTKDSVAHESDRLAPGDRICSVNGISTARLTNDEVLRLLENVEERASLEVEYYMPNYASQNSLYITTKLAEVPVEKINGSLGITIRGGLPDNSAPTADLVLNSRSLDAQPLVVTHVRPGGAAYNTSRIKPGDRLLKVDHISLTNKTLSEVHQILQNCPQVTSLTIEYDVSIMESVKLATGPLLIEIERPCNEDLGLFLTNQRYTDDVYSSGSDTYQRVGSSNAIFIDSILPASIADRCGALHPGDQLLAFDDHVIDGNNYTAEEVMCYLENSEPGFTRLHVAPRHVIAQYGRYTRENSISGASTLNPKKQRQRNYRQSSMPKLGLQDDYDSQQNYASMGVCRTESLNIQLEVPPGQSSGLAVHEENGALVISHVAVQSPAFRTGCLQTRDRVMSINGHENLTIDVANEILQRRNDSHNAKYLTLNVEFSMPNTIEASSGVFNVKLAKTSAGLGVTITGCKQKLLSNEEPMVISDIKPGSVAHRSGALAPGDQLLAINGQPLHNLSLDTAFNILQNSPDDIITLKIRKRDVNEDWSNIHRQNAKLSLQSFSNIEIKAVVHSGEDSGHHTESPNNSAKESERSHGSNENGNTAVFTVELIKHDNGPLGLTIAGSEDVNQPILLSGLVEGGLAEKCGKLQIGDELLSINGESVLSKPLSEAIKLLQQSGQRVHLQLCRKVTGSLESAECSARDSSHSTSSPGLSNDSAVESWDQNTPVRTSANCGNSEVIEYAVPDKTRIVDKQPYSPTDEDKLMACNFNTAAPYSVNDLPLPNYSLNNSLKTFHYENTCIIPENTLKNKQNITREDDVQQIEILTSNMKNCQLHNMEKSSCKCDYVQMGPYGIVSPKSRRPNWDNDFLNNGIYTVTTTPQKSPLKPSIPGTSFQFSTSPIYENDGLYNSETMSPVRGSIHHVILYKDAIYDDYGFSVSDGLYERGVYINRIRKGGPADIVGLLRPYDRILQVNGTRTVDYDCCLTVPLIAAAGDRLEIVVQRMATSRDLKNQRLEDNSSPSDSSVVTKTI